MKQILENHLTERVKSLLIMTPAAVSILIPAALRVVRLFINC